MSDKEEDVEQDDNTLRQFGISESEMKAKLKQVVENWNNATCGGKKTQQRVLRKCLVHFGLGNMGSNAHPQRAQLGTLISSVFGAKQKKKDFTSDADTVDLPYPREDDTTHLKPSQQVSINYPPLSETERRNLDELGIVRLPRVFSPQTVIALKIALTRILKEKKHERRKTLADTQGNGKNGFYFYFDPVDCRAPDRPNEANALQLLQTFLSKQLYSDHRAEARATTFIGLCYGEHGVNYTHQDNTATKHNQNPTIRYQALVLLSTPGKDFTNGELYVQDGRVPKTNAQHEWVAPVESHTSNFASDGQAGDVVIFKANGSGGGINFYHGMTMVTKGTNDVCERWGMYTQV